MRADSIFLVTGLPRSKRDQEFILPSKIKLLKTVLDQYPDDGQILKAS